MEVKEIKHFPTKSVLDFNQIFKMLDVQHKELFIVVLLPHIQTPLMQQNILSQIEALELAMKLESSPVGETGAKIMQIQTQLANLTLQFQDIKKGKEVQEELCCTRCGT